MDSTDKYNWFYKLMIKLFSISEEQRYGRKEVVKIAKSYLENKDSAVVVDVAAGQGTDLIAINNNCMGNVELYALEAYMPNIIHLQTNNIKTFQVNLERDKLPFPDSSVDIIVANQILEHCKELFWITSEFSRILKPEGIVIVGVPNLASLHCRALLLFGKQPICIETHGPHVRGFTYSDLKYFFEDGNYFNVKKRFGSGFYSIIPQFAPFLAKIMPSLAVSMVMEVKRTEKKGLFIENLNNCFYETNYYIGEDKETSYKN